MTTTAKSGFQPDYATHPGEILKETLEERGMPQSELGVRIGMSEKAISQIINGIAPISFETAMRLERVLDIPARFWNNLQSQWQEFRTAQAERESLAQHHDWLKAFPWKELVARGAVAQTNDLTQRLASVLKFFAVHDVTAWKKLWDTETGTLAVQFKKSARSAQHSEKVAAWLRLGELAAQQIPCEPFSTAKFDAVLCNARALTRQPLDVAFATLRTQCAAAGVALVLTKPIASAGIHGATRWLTKDKALLQLSGLYKSDDLLWFSLFHEAGHIQLHGKRDVFLEGIGERDQREDEADQFAADRLIPADRVPELARLKTGSMPATQRNIETFARQSWDLAKHPHLL